MELKFQSSNRLALSLLSSNRTFMELKLVKLISTVAFCVRSNRTFMELKSYAEAALTLSRTF